MPKPEPYVVAVDIGSSKVAVLIGKRDANGAVEVAGKGSAPHRGTRRGNIVSVEATVEALKAASEEAEVMAGMEISRAYVGVAGPDIRSVNVRGMVTVSRKDREITEADIGRALDAARSAALPSDREIVQALPQEFVVDEQPGINDPKGMLGSRLEVNVHLVTGQTTRSKTLTTCVNRAGIEVIEMVFEPFAAGKAVLTDDEQDLGVLLLDIGSGSTGFALFADGAIQHSAVLPIGAGHFTNDLAMVLRTPFPDAEKIKVREGCCLGGMVEDEEGITVPAVAGGAARVVPRHEICEILQARANELLSLVRDDLLKGGWDGSLRGGVVLTGGGARLDGLLELAGQVFGSSARYGLPQRITGLLDVINCPSWSTAAGLLLYGFEREANPRVRVRRPGVMRGVLERVRGVFTDIL